MPFAGPLDVQPLWGMAIRRRTTAEIGLGLGAAAARALIKYLRSEEGQRQLRRAPELIRWARERSASNKEKFPGAIEVDGREAATTWSESGEMADPPMVEMPKVVRPADERSWKSRYNPVEHFGQRGLERRMAGLRQGLALAFGEQAVSDQPQVFEALAELERATKVAAALPLSKRQRLHFRIGRQLDELEAALAAAALPG